MATSTVNPVMAAGNEPKAVDLTVKEIPVSEQDGECLKKDVEAKILTGSAMPLGLYDSNELEYGNVKYYISDGEARVDGYTGTPSKIIILDEIEGNPVTKVREGAFVGCTSLTSIQIPKSIDYRYAFDRSGLFDDCLNLKEIKVDPESPVFKSVDGILYSKDGKTLIFCPKAKSGKIKIPEGVEELESLAFYGCSKVTEITFPSTAKKIEAYTYGGKGIFENCTSLTSLQVSSKNPYYKSSNGCIYNKDGHALYMVPPGTKGVFTVPKGVTMIGGEDFFTSYICNAFKPFYDCSQITKIIIPDSVAEISGYSFLECSKLEAISVDSKNIFYCSKGGVLYNKDKSSLICCPSNAKKISIPTTVTKVAYNAFYKCSKIKKVELPSTVKTLEKFSVVESGFDLYFNSEKIPEFSRWRYDTQHLNWVYGEKKTPVGYYYESLNAWKKAIAKDENFALISWKKASGKPTITAHIELDKKSAEIDVKKSFSLKVTKSSNLKKEKVVWETSNKSIVTVNSKGKVTAKAKGVATVTAKCGGATAKCTVIVGGQFLEKPQIKKTTSPGKGKYKFTWSKVNGADGYIIDHIIEVDTDYYQTEFIKLAKDATSYTVTGLESGKKYAYGICAYKLIDDKEYTSYGANGDYIKVK